MKRVFIWFILISLFLVINIPLNAESYDTTLKEAKKLEPNKSYICCVLAEDYYLVSGSPTYIHLYIKNIDSNEVYSIRFHHNNNYYYYEIPPGKYKIESFTIKGYYHTSSNRSGIIYADTQSETLLKLVKAKVIVKQLKVDPNLLCDFDVKEGEVLYIGDYFAKKPVKIEPRTTKIERQDSFEKLSLQFSTKNVNPQITLHSLGLNNLEPESYPTVQSDLKNAKSYICGRFDLLNGSKGSYKIYFGNLAMKKESKIEFLKEKATIQYSEVEPGEYYVVTIYCGGSFRYSSGEYGALIPEQLMLPFVVNPGEVLYIGDIGIQVEGRQISSIYIYNFEQTKSEITVKFGNDTYIIKGLQDL